jgi:DNA-binding NarL/FixJ family response regulator
MVKKLHILLVDDHQIIRDGLKLLINRQPDMLVVGEASTGREAIAKVHALGPDLVVMDLSMPDLNGLQAIEVLGRECPRVKSLVLSTHEDPGYLRLVCKAKAAGYVAKRSAAEDLLQAIRKIAAGGVWFDAELSAKALAGQMRETISHSALDTAELSEREKDVLCGLAWGYGNKEIAAVLNLSVKTVETYRVRLGEKLGLRSRVEMVQYALRQGWLDETQPLLQRFKSGDQSDR